MAIKVIAFDCFGTVFNLNSVPREEVKDYIRQVRTKPWQPLILPRSWNDLSAHPDSKRGLDELRKHFTIVTCANASLGFLANLSRKNEITWDAIIPLEMVKAYKPDLKTYQLIYETMFVKPEEVLMVTGNEGSPDLIYPKELGMNVIGIRKADINGPKDIIELAESLTI